MEPVAGWQGETRGSEGQRRRRQDSNAGRKCRFSHDRNATPPAPQSINIPCKFEEAGGCRDGDRCPFKHERGQVHTQQRSASMARSANVRDSPATRQSDSRNNSTSTFTSEAQKRTKCLTLAEEVVKEQGEPYRSAFQSLLDILYNGKDHSYDKFVPFSLEEVPARFEALTWREKHNLFTALQSTYFELILCEAGGASLFSGTDEDEEWRMPGWSGIVAYTSVFKMNFDRSRSRSSDAEVARPAVPDNDPICAFHLQGVCRYGSRCLMRHVGGDDGVDEEQLKIAQEVAESEKLDCMICLEKVLPRRRFGILSSCKHAFCLECIRNWRANIDQTKLTVRRCPACRIESHFIIPSNRMIVDPDRKRKLIQEYKNNMAKIPCTHFKQGRGKCPFGTSCFFAHTYPDGTREKSKPRWRVDGAGRSSVVEDVHLRDFFDDEDEEGSSIYDDYDYAANHPLGWQPWDEHAHNVAAALSAYDDLYDDDY